MQSVTSPLIAVIGSDGSSKSTVYEHLITAIGKYGATERIHLGEQTGNVGRSVTKLPLIGKSLHKTIERNQMKTAKKSPGPVPVLVITTFVARHLLRFRRMLVCRRRGLIVLTDRYPQDQIPGTYSGAVSPPDIEGGRFVSWLANQEHKAFHWMVSHKPDLVIELNANPEVACARKPGHKRESLAKRIAVTPQLALGNAQLVDIDANQPLEKVLVDTEKTITGFMTTHGYH